MRTHLSPDQDNMRERSAATQEHATSSHSLAPPALQLKADGPLQRIEDEEEDLELQMKVNPMQREEDEEEDLGLQMKVNPVQREEDEEEDLGLQMKVNPVQREEDEEEDLELQMKVNPVQRIGEEEEAQLKKSPMQRKTNSTPYQFKLPEEVQTKMEGSMGADFSNVNIHAESSQASDVGALAYTQGNDVHFAPGQYNPGSSAGQELIGHELAHVVQQREGRVQPTGSVNGMPLNDSPALEREADEMGAKAVRG